MHKRSFLLQLTRVHQEIGMMLPFHQHGKDVTDEEFGENRIIKTDQQLHMY
jgi:hypothetical protein